MKGIWFGDTHSFDDLNLILSKAEIPPAAAKTNYVDLPGGNGSVDLTEAQGEVKYSDRECKFTFTVFPGENFEDKKLEVSNLLNGQRCKISLDKDPEFFWNGRVTVDEYASNKAIHQIVIGARVAPYKLRLGVTKVTVPAGESVVRILQNGRKRVVPTITTTANATVIFGGNTYDFGAGTHKNLGIALTEGANQVIVTSTAPVEFAYQEGEL